MTDQPIPQHPVPPIDLGNHLLALTPTNLTTSPVPNPAGPGQLLALTIRTPSTTLTVFLDREDALAYARAIRQSAQALSGLVVANGSVPDLGVLRRPGDPR